MVGCGLTKIALNVDGIQTNNKSWSRTDLNVANLTNCLRQRNRCGFTLIRKGAKDATKTNQDHLRSPSRNSCGIGFNLAQERAHMTTTWFDEMMLQLEKDEDNRRIEMNKVRCDQVLQTISVLENRIAEVTDVATKERQIIDEWEQSEASKLQRQVDWLARQLEFFIRSTDQKSITLAHGSMFLRKGKPKVTVIDMDKFLPIGEKLELIREKPSEKQADLNAISAYIRRVGTPPPFIAYTPAVVNFSYKTKGNNNGKQQTEAGSDGDTVEAEVAA
jgi:hypothetical protein